MVRQCHVADDHDQQDQSQHASFAFTFGANAVKLHQGQHEQQEVTLKLGACITTFQPSLMACLVYVSTLTYSAIVDPAACPGIKRALIASVNTDSSAESMTRLLGLGTTSEAVHVLLHLA